MIVKTSRTIVVTFPALLVTGQTCGHLRERYCCSSAVSCSWSITKEAAWSSQEAASRSRRLQEGVMVWPRPGVTLHWSVGAASDQTDNLGFLHRSLMENADR